MTAHIQLLNAQEAANFLIISKATLFDWVHERRIPFRKHGRKLVFELRALERWSQNRAIQPLEETASYNSGSYGTETPRQNAKSRSLKNESKSNQGSR